MGLRPAGYDHLPSTREGPTCKPSESKRNRRERKDTGTCCSGNGTAERGAAGLPAGSCRAQDQGLPGLACMYWPAEWTRRKSVPGSLNATIAGSTSCWMIWILKLNFHETRKLSPEAEYIRVESSKGIEFEVTKVI